MSELTLESLAKRVDELEQKLARLTQQPPAKDWRQSVGMFADSEFSRQVDAEGRAIREADRKAAREGNPE
jgi:hypothetical protein